MPFTSQSATFHLDAAIGTIFTSIQQSSIDIARLLQTHSNDYLTSTNASGDTQLAVDVRADTLLEQALLSLECVQGVCSEEKQEAIYKTSTGTISSPSLHAPEVTHNSLLVAYDPLDGSSLFNANLSVGSIFGIYNGAFHAQNLVASAYVVYGPRLEIVLAHKSKGTLEHLCYNPEQCSTGGWKSNPAPRLQPKGKLNAPGGTQKHWHHTHKAMIDTLFSQGYRLRYSGGMVPDLHHILCKGGGLFSYPATNDAPLGKLRKLFEVFPFALVYELAGGEATDGMVRLLELECASLHESTPCFLGSKEEMTLVHQTYSTI